MDLKLGPPTVLFDLIELPPVPESSCLFKIVF